MHSKLQISVQDNANDVDVDTDVLNQKKNQAKEAETVDDVKVRCVVLELTKNQQQNRRV